MKLGNLNITNLMMGSNPVQKVYQGTTLVWERQVSDLVYEYDFTNSACYPGTGTTVYDLSGNNVNGTMGAGVTFETTGIMKFNGTTTGVISITNPLIARGLGDFTLEAFFYDTGLSGDNYEGVYSSMGTNSSQYGLSVSRDKSWVGYSGLAHTTPGGWAYGGWVQAIFRRIDGVLTLYINNTYVIGHTESTIYNLNHTEAKIGSRYVDNLSWTLNGYVGLIRLYNRGISLAEIGSSYNTNINRFTIPNLIQAETTAYMNALGVPNDGTVYYSGTPQQITGAGVWSLFNNVVTYFKNNAVWDKITLWFPTFGPNTTMLGFDAKNPNGTNSLTFNGTWDFSPLGSKGDGSTAWAQTNHKPSGSVGLRGLGVVVSEGPVDATLRLEFGAASSSNNRQFIGAQVSTGTYPGPLAGFGSTLSNGPTPTVVAGITTACIVTTTVHIIKNNAVVHTHTSNSSYPGETWPLFYGCINESTQPNYKSIKRLNSAFCFNGGQNDALLINAGIEMWENGLGRKTW